MNNLIPIFQNAYIFTPSLGKKILRPGLLPTTINVLALSDSSCICNINNQKYYVAISEYTFGVDLDGKTRWKKLYQPSVTFSKL